MTILALDLGTTTGFALAYDDGTIVSGSQSFKPGRFESSAMRFIRFKKFLGDTHEAAPIDHIVFEEVRRHAGVDAAHAYGGFMSHLLAFAEEHGIPCEAYAVGAIKKFWTGKGNASKDDMIAKARAAGFSPQDDNEADALAMAHMAIGAAVL